MYKFYITYAFFCFFHEKHRLLLTKLTYSDTIYNQSGGMIMNIKNKIKSISLFIATIAIAVLLSLTIVDAETAAKTLTIKSTAYKKTPMTFPQTFHIKKHQVVSLYIVLRMLKKLHQVELNTQKVH